MRRRAALPWLAGVCLLGAVSVGALWLLVRRVAAPLGSVARGAALGGVTSDPYISYTVEALLRSR
ncbi:hypothetical protein ACIRF8_19870 [Streptomyces sp. NPDC102406]|uniref:hypothetical protein n=1 Tax=Streptomyces sp. NPDC102406 TaxID=3366171 RepID=UPI0037F4943D